MVEMPDIPIRITDDQVIEEFMLEEIDFQGIDKCKIVELQVADEKELEECMQEEAVSDIILPEVYRVDAKKHTDVKLEIPIIKAEEKCIVRDESKLVHDRTLVCETNTQAHSMTEQKVLLPERALQSKIIPNLRSEIAIKEIPMCIDLICRSSSKPTDKQNNLEGEISKKISPYLNPIYRPPPNIQNTKGERKWIFRKKPYMKSVCRPPLKP